MLTKDKLKSIEEEYENSKKDYDILGKYLVLEKSWLEDRLNYINKTLEKLEDDKKR